MITAVVIAMTTTAVMTITPLTVMITMDDYPQGRPPPSLQALTVEREVTNDDDEFGGSDDEIGDDEPQQGTQMLHLLRDRLVGPVVNTFLGPYA